MPGTVLYTGIRIKNKIYMLPTSTPTAIHKTKD